MIPQHLIFLVEDNDNDAELTMKAFSSRWITTNSSPQPANWACTGWC